MKAKLTKQAIVIGIAGVVTLGAATSSFAAPVPASTAVVKMTAPNMVEQVRYRRDRGGAIAAGAAIGVIGAIVGAAAIQNQYYYGGPAYYGPGYYQGPGYYGGGPIYYDHPGFYAAPIVPRRGGCWIVTDRDRNFGYWGRCR